MKRTLLLLRHLNTAFNSNAAVERIRAWMDIPPDAEGRRQAVEVAEAVSKLPVKCVVSSDLQRASVLGNAIAEETGAPFYTTRKLRPWNLGNLSGLPIPKAAPVIRRLMAHPNQPAPSGESFNHFYARAAQAVKLMLDAARTCDNGVIVGVTHSRVLLALPRILEKSKGPIPVKGGPHTGDGYMLTEDNGGWKMQEWYAGNKEQEGGSEEDEEVSPMRKGPPK